jgi:purine-binding chemotaxis protein CheW
MHFSTVVGDRGSAAHADRELWLLCRAGAVLCGLPLTQVVEVMRMLPIEVVGGAPPCVSGLAIIRGTPTPIVDVALLLGGHAAPAERLVTVRAGTRTVALAVAAVLGVRSIEDSAQSLPPLLREAAGDIVSAIGRLDADLLLFLDTIRLLPQGYSACVSALEVGA